MFPNYSMTPHNTTPPHININVVDHVPQDLGKTPLGEWVLLQMFHS